MDNKTILRVQNVNSALLTNDADLKDFLYKRLRKRPKDYWANKLYIRKIWDGWENFFNPKNGMFLTGILPEVKAALHALKKPYKLIDERKPVNWLYDSIDEDFLTPWLPEGMDSLKLHDYQPDLANQCIKYNRGIVQAPTGAGKTFILVSILKSLPPGTPVLFLTKNSQLVHQNWEEMKLWGVPNLGRWYGKYKEENDIMCATVHKNTFESLKHKLPEFKVLLVDEVHDCISKVPTKAYKKMKNANVRLGFSATPFKWDKKKIDQVHKWSVKSHFGPVFKTKTTESGMLTTKELQTRGILSTSNCTFYPIEHPDLEYEPYQDAVQLGIEQNFHFHEVVTKLARSRSGRTLIIVERIEQGEYLSQLMPEAHWIQGKDGLKERAPVINALKDGEKTIAIVMRHIITAGINVRVHDLINAAGGQGAHNLIQQMGRGLRTASDKDVLQYHDFMFLINDYLKKHSEWRVEVLKKENHNVTVKDEIDF